MKFKKVWGCHLMIEKLAAIYGALSSNFNIQKNGQTLD